MKKIFTLICLVVISALANAQETYYVTFVKGTVKGVSGVALKVNELLKSSDRITFGSGEDLVAVIGTKSGRQVLKPATGSKGPVLNSMVGDILNPGSARLSTRSGLLLNIIDLQNHFGKERYAVLGSTRLPISPDSFPQNDKTFFFLSYVYQGEMVNKKLSFKGDTLYLNANEILQVDGKSITDADLSNSVLKYKGATGIIIISEARFSFPNETEVKQSLSIMNEQLTKQGLSKEDKAAEMITFMAEFYGKVDKDNFNLWLQKNISNF